MSDVAPLPIYSASAGADLGRGWRWGVPRVQSMRGPPQELTLYLNDSDIGKLRDNLVVRKCSRFLLNMCDSSEELLPHEQTR